MKKQPGTIRVAQLNFMNMFEESQEYRMSFLQHELQRLDVDLITFQEITQPLILQEKLADIGFMNTFFSEPTTHNEKVSDCVCISFKKSVGSAYSIEQIGFTHIVPFYIVKYRKVLCNR